MFYVLPNRIGDEIDRRLDAELAKVPAASKDRDALRSELVEYFAEHGVIPDFSLARKQSSNGEGV